MKGRDQWCGMAWTAIAVWSGEQTKERWFSNHRPSKRGRAAKSRGLIPNNLQNMSLV